METDNLTKPENHGDFRSTYGVLINGQQVKVSCEAYETKKGDSLRVMEWNQEEVHQTTKPINEGFHLRFNPVSLPKGFTMEDFKKGASSLGLQICKGTRNDEMYVLSESFQKGMNIIECMEMAVEWYKKNQGKPKLSNKQEPVAQN